MNWKNQIADFKTGLQIEGPSISLGSFRLALFGSVGSGKSVTAGIAAIGISPKDSMIGWIDAEAGRSGFAADIVAEMAATQFGGKKSDWLARFKVVKLSPPFNPLRIVAAMEILQAAGCATIIEDCLTQAWEEDGGYLDMREEEIERMSKGEDWKRDKVAMAATAHVKPWTHGKLVSAVNQSPCNLILCFQGKQRTMPVKVDGKMQIVTSDVETPIQESGLTRTAIAAGRVQCEMVGDMPQGGFCYFRGSLNDGTKYTHPGVLKCLPKNGEQFTFAHGQALAAWAANAGNEPQASSAATTQLTGERDDAQVAAKKALWKDAKAHYGFANVDGLLAMLRSEELIGDDQTLADLNTDTLTKIHIGLKRKWDSEASK